MREPSVIYDLEGTEVPMSKAKTISLMAIRDGIMERHPISYLNEFYDAEFRKRYATLLLSERGA